MSQMRARMLQQLNQVLQTKDTARGLIVSMPDVLFGTGNPISRQRRTTWLVSSRGEV
jgi:hypothetical protein